jgi:hypothetical protein
LCCDALIFVFSFSGFAAAPLLFQHRAKMEIAAIPTALVFSSEKMSDSFVRSVAGISHGASFARMLWQTKTATGVGPILVRKGRRVRQFRSIKAFYKLNCR